MNRIVRSAVVLTFSAILASCSAYQGQKAQMASLDSPKPTGVVSTGTPDAEAVRRFQRSSISGKQATLLSELDLYKSELTAEGKYDCCVSPGCNECAIRDGECHCRHTVAQSGPCCGECTAAWIEGRGDIPGVDREKVLASLGCVRELYEKKIPDGATPTAAAAPAQPHH